MKITIGPYLSPIVLNWHRNYMHAKYGYCWDLNGYKPTKWENYFERIEDFLQNILNKTINPLLNKRERKIKVKIHPYDTWSTDYTLALIVLPLIKQLRATKQGCPLVPDEDVPAGLGIRSTDLPPKENEWEWDDNCHKRWDWVLNEIQWTFEQLVNPEHDTKFFTGGVFSEGDNKDPVRVDEVGLKAHNERIQRGCVLFGKNLQNLWD